MRALPLVLVLSAASLEAQDAEWLRPVATIDLQVPQVLAGDVAPDGSKVVTVDDHRDVVVHAFEPWRELSRAAVGGTAAIDDVRFDRDGKCVVVTMAAGETAPAQVFAVVDGARVEGTPPAVPDADATPPGVLTELQLKPEFVRAARDGRTAVFRSMGSLGVSRGAALRWLTSDVQTVALTGDGRHVVVVRSTGVDVYPVAGGEAWHVPIGFSPRAAAAPFGAAAGFVCVDSEHVVVADAAARRETARIALDVLQVKWDSVRLVAADADGQRVVVTAATLGGKEDATHLLDLQRHTATNLPTAGCLAFFAPNGVLLLDGRIGPCDVVLGPVFRWSVDGGTTWRVWQPQMGYANGALLRDRAEVVHLTPIWGTKSLIFELRRCDAGDGRVLAKVDVHGVPADLALVGDHVVVFDAVPDDPRQALTLHRLDDLATVASAQLPRAADHPLETLSFCAAAAAPRIALWDDEVTVFEVVPPRDGGKENGAGRK